MAMTERDMQRRSFIKIALPAVLVVVLGVGFALRHRIAIAADVALSTMAVADLPPLEDGDIIFQTSRSSQSAAIQPRDRSGAIWA